MSRGNIFSDIIRKINRENVIEEREMQQCRKAEKYEIKKVLVLGGGPAGLEAARTASLMGNNVVIYEKSNELGGVLKKSCISSNEKDMTTYLEWSISSVLNKSNIKIHLNSEPTTKTIEAEKPDVVFGTEDFTKVFDTSPMNGEQKIRYYLIEDCNNFNGNSLFNAVKRAFDTARKL